MPLVDGDSLFPLDGMAQDLAREPCRQVKGLPIVGPHGHTDACWFAGALSECASARELEARH